MVALMPAEHLPGFFPEPQTDDRRGSLILVFESIAIVIFLSYKFFNHRLNTLLVLCTICNILICSDTP
jgi:hypothetical protein